MTKALLVLIAAVNVGSIWLDPFTHTFHPAGPDPSPFWWRLVSVMDTLLLVAFAWSVIAGKWQRAHTFIAVSATFSLFMNALYVWVRGVDRFLVIFGTAQILSPYLFLIGLRVVALFVCGIAAMNSAELDRGPGS